MTRKAGQRRQKPRLYKYDLTDDGLLALVAEIMPLGEGATPVSAHVWCDGRGRPRRIKAAYPNGWTVRISFDVDGRVTSRGATVKLVTPARQPPADARVPA